MAKTKKKGLRGKLKKPVVPSKGYRRRLKHATYTISVERPTASSIEDRIKTVSQKKWIRHAGMKSVETPKIHSVERELENFNHRVEFEAVYEPAVRAIVVFSPG